MTKEEVLKITNSVPSGKISMYYIALYSDEYAEEKNIIAWRPISDDDAQRFYTCNKSLYRYKELEKARNFGPLYATQDVILASPFIYMPTTEVGILRIPYEMVKTFEVISDKVVPNLKSFV
jgi:hypothetical protein